MDDDEKSDDGSEGAWRILKTHPMWQEPGRSAWAARAHRDLAEPFVFVYYRIRLDRVTGHEATPDARDAATDAVPPQGR